MHLNFHYDPTSVLSSGMRRSTISLAPTCPYLKQFGIALECAGDADEGMRKLVRTDPDLLLLDVMLPGRDGFDICREVRKTSQIPIIMLTARGDVVDRVSGLEIGADD